MGFRLEGLGLRVRVSRAYEVKKTGLEFMRLGLKDVEGVGGLEFTRWELDPWGSPSRRDWGPKL